jgi:hypothetical protein
MRWTDLPRDRESPDADPPVLRRGEWDDLRQRLERLPAGHPSSPEGGARADGDNEAREDDEARADEARADEPRPDEAKPDESAPDERPESEGRPDRRERPGPGGRSGRGGHDAGSAAADGRREPYRPWFTSGESPEPWFSADPDG